MKKIAFCALLSIGVLSPAMAQNATTLDSGTSAAPIHRNDDTNHTDWGWVGLFGLAGLAGLAGKNRRNNYNADRVATSSSVR